jgi:ABC-type enterochelin transport system permease subunit
MKRRTIAILVVVAAVIAVAASLVGGMIASGQLGQPVFPW